MATSSGSSSKSYQLLEEFTYVGKNRPKGVYLIPVPHNLQDKKGEEPANPVFHHSRIPVDSSVPPWQGVLFIRNTASPYFGGVFRFDICFTTFAQIRKYLQPTATPNSAPYSYDWYPVIRLQSEIHTRDERERHIAEYCLDGIEAEESSHVSQSRPFSRVLYVLKRLVTWFEQESENHHDRQLASTDVKVSQSDTLLYQTVKNNDQLITFSPGRGISQDVLDVLRHRT